MSEAMIKCPKCGFEIELAKSMAGPMMDKMKKEHTAELERVRSEIQDNILDKAKEEAKAEFASIEKKNKDTIDQLLKERQQAERTRIETQNILRENESKLAEAQDAQAAALKQSRELETQRREMEITIERRVAADIDKAKVEAKWAAENAMEMRVKEKELTIESMQKVIADLKQKSEQGSTQTQGEIQELVIESSLRARFMHDVIAEVPKGINGADCMQEVKDSTGKPCGTIIWESKRTKAWQDGWLTKLREDQRTAQADIAILVTQTMPKDAHGFDIIDGVWVCEMGLILPIATILRQSLIEVALARGAGEGQKTKMEILYGYMTGLKFKQRMQAIVEAFTAMQDGLQKERKAITKSWALREEQLNNVMESSVGMYGDIQGIAGRAVKEIEGLEIKQIGKEE